MRRITSCAMLLALMMLVSLIAGTASWGGTGKVELRPAGYELTAPAYVVPVRDGRDTVELIETQAAELSALSEYLAAQNASLERVAAEFETLEAAVAEERQAWHDEAEKLAQRNERLSSPWSIGFFGGDEPFRDGGGCGVGGTNSVGRFLRNVPIFTKKFFFCSGSKIFF